MENKLTKKQAKKIAKDIFNYENRTTKYSNNNLVVTSKSLPKPNLVVTSMSPTKPTNECPHCKGDIAIRNPMGFCDHLYYPTNCEVCKNQPKPTEEWEKEYENEFWFLKQVNVEGDLYDHVKDFISNLLQKERDRARKDTINKIVRTIEEYEELNTDDFGTFDLETFGQRMLEIKNNLKKTKPPRKD